MLCKTQNVLRSILWCCPTQSPDPNVGRPQICSALLYFILNFSIVCCHNFVLIVRLGLETKPTGFGIRKYCFSSTNTSGKCPNVSELWSRPLHMWHKLERVSRLQKHKITNISCKNVPFSQLMLPRKRHFLTSNSSLFCTNLHNSRQKWKDWKWKENSVFCVCERLS